MCESASDNQSVLLSHMVAMGKAPLQWFPACSSMSEVDLKLTKMWHQVANRNQFCTLPVLNIAQATR